MSLFSEEVKPSFCCKTTEYLFNIKKELNEKKTKY